MRVAAGAGRFGLVLAVLLVLFGASVPAPPRTADGDTAQHPVSVTGESPSSAPSMYDELQDWLRLSAGTLRAPAAALPDTWWAVSPHATGECPLPKRSRLGQGDSAAMAAATPTAPSSRAPPLT